MRAGQGRSSTRSASRKARRSSSHKARLVRRYGAGGGRHGLRREGPGRHGRAQGRDLPARLRAAHRAGRASIRTTSSSTRTSSRSRTGHRGAQRLRASNFIEATRDHQGDLPRREDLAAASRNLSFSFRGNNVVREAMHSAFLYHAIQAGMDMGIVNAGQLVVYEEIPQGAARARRGRALQPPARRDRAAGRRSPRRVKGSGQEEGARPRVARRAGRGAARRTRSSRASSTSSRPTSRRRARSYDAAARRSSRGR